MSQVAKLFINGRSQAVRLPVAYRFDAKEVFIRHDTLERFKQSSSRKRCSSFTVISLIALGWSQDFFRWLSGVLRGFW